MGDITIHVETGRLNLSPVMSRISAHEYFKAYLDFKAPNQFSAVPFFLCCRSIELALKALHLESKSQKEVKKLYSHNLLESYRDLDPAQQILNLAEQDLLAAASAIYAAKEFEYLNVLDAVTAYRRFPSLADLSALTRKIAAYDA